MWFLAVLFCLVLFAGRSSAWIYPEHRDITLLAVQELDAERRAILNRLWAEARSGHEKRLCEQAADTGQARKPSCVDWAAWPAIAGDHSCSAENMVHTILTTGWILRVADIAARLKEDLAGAKTRSQRVNAVTDSDIRLLRADEEYVTRAGANNAHFLLARLSVDEDGLAYVTRCLNEGAELNALGVYAWYHLSALEKASRLSRGGLSPEQRSALALAALADEAFALHFLEDTYAAGHVAGTWGNASLRKGTHDYYNEQGLEARRWKGKSIVLMGDGYMRPEDAERAAEAVRTSLEQVLDAASGRGPTIGLPADAAGVLLPDTFNVCTSITMPARTRRPILRPLFAAVILDVPVPGLGPGPGDLPRFRAELGPFVGLSVGGGGTSVSGGFGTTQTTSGAIGSLEGAVRLGFGLEGVLDEAGDGLVFLDLGVRLDSASSMKITDDPTLAQGGSISAAIPSRSALTARLRMPFWLIPGDLVLASPLLAIDPDTYAKMAVVAANGGLIPWQAGIATPLGRFQFVLGREVGVSFYGILDDDRLVIPPTISGAGSTLIDLQSIRFEFPVLEYRPFRTFSQDQSASLVVQLFAGFEVPTSASVVSPAGAPEPDLKTIWQVGIRIVFDWRYYFD
ncbi:MAG: hypothetical protein ACREKR_03480 [Candidatus Methylomirabilales bacterium]